VCCFWLTSSKPAQFENAVTSATIAVATPTLDLRCRRLTAMAPSFAFVGAVPALRTTRTPSVSGRHATTPARLTGAFLGARVSPQSTRAAVTAVSAGRVTTMMAEKKVSKTLRDTPIEDVRNVGIVA
jgi:hypothetical protein